MSFFSWWIWIEFGGFYLAFLQPALDPNSLMCFFPVMFFGTPTSNLEGSILRHPGSAKNLYYGNFPRCFFFQPEPFESTELRFLDPWSSDYFSGEVAYIFQVAGQRPYMKETMFLWYIFALLTPPKKKHQEYYKHVYCMILIKLWFPRGWGSIPKV